MQEKTKKIVLLIGSIMIAVFFLTSYAAFSNNNTGTSSTTTVPSNVKTIPVTGTANAIIANYSDRVLIIGDNSTVPILNTTVANMEANGLISNYIYNNDSYDTILSGINAYQLYLNLTKVAQNVTVESVADVNLPKTINMYYSTTGSIPVSIPQTGYLITLNKTLPINSTIPVKIIALVVESNGTIYNNNIRISPVPG